MKPQFTLPDSDGDAWSVSDHAGKTVVLIFHRHIH
ncbi:MAG: peroxiredoxin family protein [Acidimicrobiales bacterium]